MIYSRFVSPDSEFSTYLTREHVKDHLLDVVNRDPNNPQYDEDDIRMWTEEVPGGQIIYGEINAEPDAYYLDSDYDPENDEL
jgi:hypothetical protein